MTVDPGASSQPGSELCRRGEQRQWVRHACGPEVTCRLLGGKDVDCWAVRVHNLSLGGISLVLNRLITTGRILTAELHNQTRQFSCQRQIRVIYTLQDANGEVTAGGAFSPYLTQQELEGLV